MQNHTLVRNYRTEHKCYGVDRMIEVTCNKCGWQGEEEDLVMFEDEDGIGKGCPTCKTDCYLMDKEMIE